MRLSLFRKGQNYITSIATVHSFGHVRSASSSVKLIKPLQVRFKPQSSTDFTPKIVNKKNLLRPPPGTTSLSPAHIFHNSIALGSPHDILSAYKGLQNSPEHLNQVARSQYSHLCGLIANESSFPNMTPLARAELAISIRNDLVKVNYNIRAQLEADIISCFAVLPSEYSHVFFEHIQILSDYYQNTESINVFTNSYFTNILWGVAGKLGCTDAIQAFYESKRYTIPPLALVKAHAPLLHFQTAEKAFKSIESTGHQYIEGCLTMMEMYASQGDVVQTRRYLDKLVDKLSNGTSQAILSAKARGYGALLIAHAERGQPGDVDTVYRKMRDQGLSIPENALTAAIRVHGSSLNLTSAIKYFFKKENVPGFEPSIDMYAALIQAYMTNQDSLAAWRTAKKAIQAFEQKCRTKKHARLPVSVLLPLAQEFEGKHVDFLHDRVKNAGFTKSATSRLVSHLMHASNTLSLPQQTLTLYNEYKNENGCAYKSDIPLLAHIQVMKAHALLKQSDKARVIYDKIIDSLLEERIEVTNALIAAYALENKTAEIQALLTGLRDMGITPTLSVYESLLQSVDIGSESEKWDEEIVKDVVSHVKPFMYVNAKSHQRVHYVLTKSGVEVFPLV